MLEAHKKYKRKVFREVNVSHYTCFVYVLVLRDKVNECEKPKSHPFVFRYNMTS